MSSATLERPKPAEPADAQPRQPAWGPEWILCPGGGGAYHRDDISPCSCGNVQKVISRGPVRVKAPDGTSVCRVRTQAVCTRCLPLGPSETVLAHLDCITKVITLASRQEPVGRTKPRKGR